MIGLCSNILKKKVYFLVLQTSEEFQISKFARQKMDSSKRIKSHFLDLQKWSKVTSRRMSKKMIKRKTHLKKTPIIATIAITILTTKKKKVN
jgi:hypothetical protein